MKISTYIPTLLALLVLPLLSPAAPTGQQLQNYLDSVVRPQLPAPGEPLFDTLNWRNFYYGNSQFGRFTLHPVANQPYESILRMEGLKRPASFHSVQVATARNLKPIRKGDVLFFTYQARCLKTSRESGDGVLGAVFAVDGPTWRGFGGGKNFFGKEWKTLYGYGVAPSDYPAGTVRLQLYFSFIQQTIEVGGFAILNLGAVDTAKLPKAKIQYRERPDQLWHSEAEKRIQQIRTSAITLKLTTADGTPIVNAPITITQQKHHFGFGCYTDDGPVLRQDADGQRFRQEFLRLFNRATVPMFWGPGNAQNRLWGWENPESRQRYLSMLKWACNNQLQTQSHVLMWPTPLYAPPDVLQLMESPEKLRQRINGHIAQQLKTIAPYLHECQVLNEPGGTKDFQKVLGEHSPAEWFKEARKYLPTQKLILNDNSIISIHREAADAYEQLIKQLLQDGAPLTGLGFQGHIGIELPGPRRIWQIFDRFGAYKMPIYITEFTVFTEDDEELQAEYTRDFLTACFSHPACHGVIFWGFWEGKHYEPRCALFRKDWSPRPNGKVYQELVLKQWRTNAAGNTDVKGCYALQAYHGTYQGEVTLNGKKHTFTFKVLPGDDQKNAITITLPAGK